MVDWTEESVRSLTSRQVEARARSARVRVLEDEEEEEEAELQRSCRLLRMTESGLRRFLKGSLVSSSSEFGSALRRFFLSAITKQRER